MRIEKPYRPTDKHCRVLLDGQDLTGCVSACDDEEGWVDMLFTLRTSKGAFKLILEKGEPIIHRAFGKVEIQLHGA